MKAKLDWIDIAKGLAICMVVTGHAGNRGLADFVYLFHLSLFIFLSGYFWNTDFLQRPYHKLKKRILRLYVPYLIYEMLFLLLHNALFQVNIYSLQSSYSGRSVKPYSIQEYLKQMLAVILGAGREPIIGAMWFVVTLMMIHVIYTTITGISHLMHIEKYISSVLILIFIVNCILMDSKIFIPRLSQAILGLPIYHFGYYYRKNEEKVNLPATFAFLLLILLYFNSTKSTIGYTQDVSGKPIFFLATSVVGIMASVTISKHLAASENTIISVIRSIIMQCGKASYDIMALHFLAFKLVNLIIIKINSYSIERLAEFPTIEQNDNWFWVYTVVGLAIPLGISYIRRKCIERWRYRS